MSRGTACTLLIGTITSLCIDGTAPLCAAENETRSYTVSVDGKRAGTYTQVIARRDDGVVTVSSTANVSVSYLVVRYTYQLQAAETWQQGILRGLNSQTNDNGKQSTVAAVPEQNGVRVTTNGQARIIQPPAWTTTYWRLPDATLRAQPLVLLDVDTGRDIPVRLQLIGTQQINVAGQVQPCTHYRVTGGVTADLWYDAQERLVRQDGIEDGHRTTLELAGVRR